MLEPLVKIYKAEALMEDAGGLLKYNRETENNNRNEDKDKVLFSFLLYIVVS